jgi:hypothetical protein
VAKRSSADARVMEFVSPMPIDECCHLLRTEMDGPLRFFGSRPTVGRIHRTKLRARKRILYSNAWQPRIIAEMTEQAGQTHISCRFSMRRLGVAALVIWCGFNILNGVGALIPLPRLLTLPPFHGPAPISSAVIDPLWGFLSGYGVMRFGRFLARNERDFLLGFVGDTLKAKPV